MSSEMVLVARVPPVKVKRPSWAALAIRELVDGRIEAARERARREAAEVGRLRRAEREQRREGGAALDLQESLAGLSLLGLRCRPERRRSESAGRAGAIPAAGKEDGPRATLERLAGRLAEIPEEVARHPDSPCGALAIEIERLRRRSRTRRGLDTAAVNLLETEVEASLARFLESLERRAALRGVLLDRACGHLEEMGYEALGEIDSDRASGYSWAAMRIPGGERLRMRVDPLNRLELRLEHESRDGRRRLTPEEVDHFRRQESRWCREAKVLLDRLREDGFELELDEEFCAPTDSIPIVRVVPGEELAGPERVVRRTPKRIERKAP